MLNLSICNFSQRYDIYLSPPYGQIKCVLVSVCMWSRLLLPLHTSVFLVVHWAWRYLLHVAYDGWFVWATVCGVISLHVFVVYYFQQK